MFSLESLSEHGLRITAIVRRVTSIHNAGFSRGAADPERLVLTVSTRWTTVGLRSESKNSLAFGFSVGGKAQETRDAFQLQDIAAAGKTHCCPSAGRQNLASHVAVFDD